MEMTTIIILVAQYDAKETLQFQKVAKKLFGITPTKFLKHLKSREIDSLGEDPGRLKTIGVFLSWVAEAIDNRRELAQATMYALQFQAKQSLPPQYQDS